MFLLLLISTVAHAATTRYYYDDLGRIVQAIGSDGTIQQYQYDHNGNVTAINRVSGSALTVSGLSPTIGHVTASVTIYGTGFSATPSENSVKFGAIPAVVTEASVTHLVATVPQGAVTGPISVAVNGNQAISKTIYVVRTPAISNFSPAFIDPGSPVTVLGTDLNLIPGSTAFTVGGLPTTLNSAINRQAVFAAPNGSGVIGINTPYGNATSATSLTVIPSAITKANVSSFGPFLPGAPAQAISLTQSGKHVVLRLDATVGQVYSIHLSSMVVVPNTSSVQFMIYSPTNSVFHAAGFSSAASAWIHLPQIPATGTYLITITNPYTTSSTQMSARLVLHPEITADGAPLDLTTTSAGEMRRYSFRVTAGENFGLALMAPTTTAWQVQAQTKALNGTAVTNGAIGCFPNTAPGCAAVLRNLPAGLYSIDVYPLFPSDAAFGGTLRFSRSVTGALLEGTNDVNVSIPGQNTALTFTTNGAENITLNLRSVVTTPANRHVNLAVYDSTMTSTNWNVGPNGTLNLPDLPAGTYTAVIVPANASTASMQVVLEKEPTHPLVANGSTSSYSTSVVGQSLYFTFNGTAGQSLGLALSNLTFGEPWTNAGVYLTPPGGTETSIAGCYVQFIPGCPVSLRNLPATGVYKLRVTPSQQSTMSFTATLTQNVTGTLTSAAPLNVNLNLPGRQALITFNNPTTQNVALNLRSVVTAPAGKNVSLTVYNSTGAQIPGASTLGTNSAATLNMENLPAGAYSVLLVPENAVTATMQLAIATSNTATLLTNGAPANFSATLPGQSRYFTFTATAGQTFALAMTDLVLTPNSGSVLVQVIQPNGYAVDGVSAHCNAPGCQFNSRPLPLTGTYTVRVEPNTQTTMSFTFALSQGVSGSLTAGSPLNVNLPARGQHALLTFSAAAGQTFALNVASISTQPAGRAVSVSVRYPNGSSQATSSNTGLTLNLHNLEAGAYSVMIVPSDATNASLQALLAPGLTGTMTASGTTHSHATTVPGQAAYFTFDATAGQNLGVAVTNFLMSSGTRGRLAVIRPNTWAQYSGYCDVPRCSTADSLFNLPLTGRYTIVVDPESYASMSFDVTLSSSVTGALTQGTPLQVNFAAPGQTGFFTFTASAGQPLVLSMSSVAMAPSGSSVRVEVYRPNGNFLDSLSISSAGSFNFTNLAAGTYTIRMTPALGATGTLQLLVQ
jgi:YD repeat-containing protein